MARIYLSDELCDRAREKMAELMNATEDKGITIQHRAADSLLRGCQTQERYGLNPQTPAEFTRATAMKNSQAQRLAALSEADIDALARQADLASDYPGKPS